jgi:hypothetical protein
MILSSHTIPEPIIEEMFKSIEPFLDKNSLNLKAMINAEKFLENTKYATTESIEMNSSIFKNDVEDSDDFSFITDRKTNKKIF